MVSAVPIPWSQLDARAQEALRDQNTRLEAQVGWSSRARVMASGYSGSLLSLSLLTLEGIAGWENEQPEDLLTIALAIFGSQAGTVGGRSFQASPHRLSFVRLPGERLRLGISSPRAQLWLLHLPLVRLQEEFTAQGGRRADLASLIRTLADVESYLIASAERLLVFAGDGGASSLRPSLLLERALLSVVGAHLREASATDSPVAFLPPGAWHVKQALAYLEDHSSEPLSLASISRACGVSSRTLQAAFALHHSCSPMEALLQLRLQKLREALLRGQGSVRQACDAVGLRFSGRTAQAYRRLFGELPSQTQRQAAGPGAVIPMDVLRTHRENRG